MKNLKKKKNPLRKRFIKTETGLLPNRCRIIEVKSLLFSSDRFSTISIVSFPAGLDPARAGLVSSRHKVVPVGAPVRAHTAALPAVPVLHVAEDALELLTVLGLGVTEELGQRVPGEGGG